ncbi:MAG TPA: hypothetical protein VKZ94_05530 [Advenella sp.]|nr:hypothetical protein [Advenella sp.]
MKMFSIYSGQEPEDLNAVHTNVLVCNACAASEMGAFEDADEMIEISCDPSYEDRCKLCGKTFEQEIEEHATVRIR